jgi:hypothetical protein
MAYEIEVLVKTFPFGSEVREGVDVWCGLRPAEEVAPGRHGPCLWSTREEAETALQRVRERGPDDAYRIVER